MTAYSAEDRALGYLARTHGALMELLTAMDQEDPARIEAQRNEAHTALALPPDLEASIERRLAQSEEPDTEPYGEMAGDHYNHAEELLARHEKALTEHPRADDPKDVEYLLRRAQVHATLALARRD